MSEKDTRQPGDDERGKTVLAKPDLQLDTSQFLRGIDTKSLTTLRTDLNRARNEYRLGHDEEAIATVRKLLHSLDQIPPGVSSVESQEQVQRSLLYAASLTMIGRSYERQGQVREAQAAFSQAVVLFDQELPPYITGPTDLDYSDYGLALYKVNRKVDAELALRKALELGNTTAETYLYLALCLQEQRLYSKAEQHLRKAMEVAVDPAPIYEAIGETLEAQQRIDEAVDMYQEAIQALLLDERWNEAITAIDRLLPLMPT